MENIYQQLFSGNSVPNIIRIAQSFIEDITKNILVYFSGHTRQEFLGSRSSTVERSFTRTAAAGTFLRFFQTIFENTSLRRLKRLVSLSTYRRYINKCIYLNVSLYNISVFILRTIFVMLTYQSCSHCMSSPSSSDDDDDDDDNADMYCILQHSGDAVQSSSHVRESDSSSVETRRRR